MLPAAVVAGPTDAFFDLPVVPAPCGAPVGVDAAGGSMGMVGRKTKAR